MTTPLRVSTNLLTPKSSPARKDYTRSRGAGMNRKGLNRLLKNAGF
jgi:hypothetical protein